MGDFSDGITMNFPAAYGGAVTLEVTGFREMARALDALAAQIPGEVGNAVRAEAEIEMTEAKQRTPLLTGALQASGHVTGPEQDGRDQVIRMGFGGPAGSGNHGGESNNVDVGYAVWVHENMEALHPRGQAKFLESVLLESAPYLLERVAARIDLTRAMR